RCPPPSTTRRSCRRSLRHSPPSATPRRACPGRCSGAVAALIRRRYARRNIQPMRHAMNFKALLKSLDLDATGLASGKRAVRSPIDGKEIARVRTHSQAQVRAAVGKTQQAFAAWRDVPAPKRGELIRLLGEELRAAKDQLGELVTVENGKILVEGKGE